MAESDNPSSDTLSPDNPGLDGPDNPGPGVPVPDTPNPGRIRLRAKIALPYAGLAIVIGIGAAYLMTLLLVGKLEERFNNHLLDMGKRVADTVVRLERRHLENWRLIAFTAGLGEAVLQRDQKSLTQIAGLSALNACLDTVDVLDKKGHAVFSAHRQQLKTGACSEYDFRPFEQDYSQWPAVQSVLKGSRDSRGDKFVNLVKAGPHWVIYTAGPIRSESGDHVGTLLVGTYLSSLVRQTREAALADITIFGPEGTPLATTFPIQTAPSLTKQAYASILEMSRQVQGQPLVLGGQDYTQVLGTIVLRGDQKVAVFGTALPTKWLRTAATPLRNWLMAAIGGAVVLTLLLGSLVASRIVRPIYELLDASQQVARGDLTQQVEVNSNDEIGTLAHSFNHMVRGLRERERERDVFGRVVSPGVREKLLHGALELGGETRKVTVLFSDIRGFTARSENESPQRVIAFLNEYLSEMTAAVRVWGGYVNNFIGDGLVVIFGAPDDLPETERLAVNAAFDMRDALARINQARSRRGETAIESGIGISTGEVVAGQIGSLERFMYTVIGDTVNVAARLESLTKSYPEHPILLNQATALPLEQSDEFRTISLGPVQVKGRQETVEVYAVSERSSEEPSGGS